MPLGMIVSTAITTAVGILVKELLNLVKSYVDESKAWRKTMDNKLDMQTKALQTTMRAQLIHNAEKYIERDWITPEERASWCDMHERYSALGANGLIETYRQKINALPDKEI